MTLTAVKVATFIRTHIIYRYGVPHELISDKGAPFKGEVDKRIERLGIRQHKSSIYRTQTNGVVEAANKNIKRILRKMVETSKDQSKKLPYTLWAYHTSICTSTGATPYSLIYGMKVVLPIETEIHSLRTTIEHHIDEAEWTQSRYNRLTLLDEKRLRAVDHVQAYQRKMVHAFQKQLKPRVFQKGDLVLRVLRGFTTDPRGKFRPNSNGPSIIYKLTSEGAARLMDLDGNLFSEPTNVDQLKKFYA